ncbi:MAG TPA: Clp protease N-terminal domain-containing protein, partial [Burkholderiaceae bacterium]|nr:Clp protease N-terminal domain-containing protein [Burkholderiaceae bacterium]
MRIDRLTTKFQQALADAQSLALRNDNPYLEPAHVLAALLADNDSGAASLLAHAGVSVNRVVPAIDEQIEKLPQVKGASGNLQVGRDLQKAFARTDKEASTRGDDYIASELFLLALVDDEGETGRILREAGLQRKPLEAAIDAVRGGEPVTDADSESKREALAKYTTDLTELARQGKLDPVIGRDDEIRRSI